MDAAYDHIAEQIYSGDRASTPIPPKTDPSATSAPASSETRPNLQSELQETLKAFSSSPWGSKLGGLWGNVRKHSESYYEGARREAEAASGEALKGFTDLKDSLVSRTRGMSLGEQQKPQIEKNADSDTKAQAQAADVDASLRENDTFIARFRSEAAKRLKDIEKAEDAADEALLRFGTNIRNFLKDAVAVAPPEAGAEGREGTSNSVLFESRDASGKRVIHTTRFDAQLHAIHTAPTNFTEDPTGGTGEWTSFSEGFDIDQKTGTISKDLEAYPELRSAMEKLVPEKVEYKDFWRRYYFLRHVIQVQEERRKEVLKASSNATEEVAWDEDSDDENEAARSTPQINEPSESANRITMKPSSSTTTLQQIPQEATETLKPEGRRSHDEKSVADSDASYDLVSGATSRAPGSPKEESKAQVGKSGGEKAVEIEEEEEEDWE